MKKNLFLVFSLLFLSTNFVFAQNYPFNLQTFLTNYFNQISPLQIKFPSSLIQQASLQTNTVISTQNTQAVSTDAIVKNFENNPNMIKAVQDYLGVKPDGVLGPQTMNAINKFRAEQNSSADNGDKLPISKTIDDKTLQRLDDQMSQSQTSQDKQTSDNSTQNFSQELECANGNCLGKGRATTFNHSTLSCGKGNPYNECYAAISIEASKKLCAGKGTKCYCNQIASTKINGQSISIPIRDIGAAKSDGTSFAKGTVLDITPGCIKKVNTGNACRGGGENTSCYGVEVKILDQKTQTASK